jgi:hypothetical protein
MRKGHSVLVAMLALTVALAGAVIARADGASENQAFVDGKVKPAKLDKKKFKRVNFFVGVRTQANVTGMQANPQSEYISFGKNAKFKLNKAPLCTTPLPNGATPEQARAMCPRKSYLGSGHGTVEFPGLTANDVVVSVFNGPIKNQLRLHTYSPTLGTASPTVDAKIVRSNAGRAYGQALSVPNAPITGSGMITEFNANIQKSSGVAFARCKSKKFLFQRQVTYTDGSSDTVTTKQPCKRKAKKNR